MLQLVHYLDSLWANAISCNTSSLIDEIKNHYAKKTHFNYNLSKVSKYIKENNSNLIICRMTFSIIMQELIFKKIVTNYM